MTPAEPRDAATVILIRDHVGGGLDVYLIKRPGGSNFLGGADVFPGGKVDPADGSRRRLRRLRLRDDTLSEGPQGSIARLTAIRETYEETGVLITQDAPPDLQAPDARDLDALLDAWDGELDGTALVHVSRWITPELEPRRFDTHFYLAVLPAGQTAINAPVETVEGLWLQPSEAIDLMLAEKMFLAPPTLRSLELLAQATNTADALASGRATASPVVKPKLVLEGSRVVILLPGDPDFGPADEGPRLPGPTRLELAGLAWHYPGGSTLG